MGERVPVKIMGHEPKAVDAGRFGGISVSSSIHDAIADAQARGQQAVFIPAGVWNISDAGPIIIPNGMHIYGVPPTIKNDFNCPDLGFTLVGGTIIRGDGTFNAITDNAVAGGECTFDTTTDTVVRTAHGFSDDDVVYFTTTGSLPTGITASVSVYVVNAASNSFKVSDTKGGTPVDLGGTPTGTHIVHGNSRASASIIERLGFDNFLSVFKFGANESNGLSFSAIRDIQATTTEDWFADFKNSQHITVSGCRAWNVKRGIQFSSYSSGCAPGISSAYDCFMHIRSLFSAKPDYPRRYGYCAVNELAGSNFQLDGVRFYSCQTNMYGPTTPGTYTFGTGDVNTSTDRITQAAHGHSDGDPIRYYGSDIPAPLVVDNVYFIKSATTNDYQLSTLEDLSDTVDLTDVGSGTHTARYYPGDSVGYCLKGADATAIVGAPVLISPFSDGQQNNFYRFEHCTPGFAQINQFGANLHGTRAVAMLSSQRMMLACTDSDTTIFACDNCNPWFLSGTAQIDPDARLPKGIFLDAADSTTTVLPVSSTQTMQGNDVKWAWEVGVRTNNTWPSISVGPVYYSAHNADWTQGKDRMGTTRYSGLSAGRTHTLPSVQTVAVGSRAEIFNDDPTHSVTVAFTGGDTCNGTSQTLTVASKQVAILDADNIGARTNWIGRVVAVVDS